MRRLWLVIWAVLFAAPGSASGFVIQEHGGLASATNGIVLGPDGNLWISEIAGNAVRMKPNGEVIARYALGGEPTSLAVGPGGRVWVSVTGADKLTWFDATAAAPAPHDVSTGGQSTCGPVGIVSGGDGRMYFSLPNAGGCEGDPPSRVGSTLADGTGGTSSVTGLGKAFDLEVVGGKLFVPDFDDTVIRRAALPGLTVETSVSVSGGNPDGIASDGAGNLWVTLYNAGKVARFPATQEGSSAAEIAPAGGTLTNPFGIVRGPDGRMYVTGQESANLARIDSAGSFAFYPTPGGKPFQITVGPDEDLWFTDVGANRVLRFVNAAPRATTGDPRALAPTAASFDASVDPRGNATKVFYDFGTSTAYGQTAGPFDVASGAAPVAVPATVGGLAPNTTYHVRVRASNAEGETLGADKTFTTPPAPPGPVDADGDGVSPPTDCNDGDRNIRPGAVDLPGDKIDQDCKDGDAPFPLLAAKVTFSWSLFGRLTALTKVRLQGLRGDETVAIACRGRGCPFKRRTVRPRKKGAHKLDALFGRRRRMRSGAVVTVRITAPSAIGSSATVTMRARRDPRIVRRCLPPASTKPVRC